MRGDCAPAALRTCARGSVLRGSVRGSPRPRVSPRVCRGGWGALRERGAGTRGSVCVRGSACPYPWVATRVRTRRGGGGGGGGALRDRGAGTPRDVASAASVGPCPWVPTAARVHPVKSPQTSGVGHRGSGERMAPSGRCGAWGEEGDARGCGGLERPDWGCGAEVGWGMDRRRGNGAVPAGGGHERMWGRHPDYPPLCAPRATAERAATIWFLGGVRTPLRPSPSPLPPLGHAWGPAAHRAAQPRDRPTGTPRGPPPGPPPPPPPPLAAALRR